MCQSLLGRHVTPGQLATCAQNYALAIMHERIHATGEEEGLLARFGDSKPMEDNQVAQIRSWLERENRKLKPHVKALMLKIERWKVEVEEAKIAYDAVLIEAAPHNIR